MCLMQIHATTHKVGRNLTCGERSAGVRSPRTLGRPTTDGRKMVTKPISRTPRAAFAARTMGTTALVVAADAVRSSIPTRNIAEGSKEPHCCLPCCVYRP